ncbi:MAG: hypothetical protein LBH17_04320 [Oscillospiraceae bacterium]|jgi:hypothetical protein|nr:hypothetical protein [Oscillospiraceae bacterium]
MMRDDERRDIEELSEEDFTLESILADYKSSSYIDGERRTPKEVLDEKARRIVLEESGIAPEDIQTPIPDPEAASLANAVINAAKAAGAAARGRELVEPRHPLLREDIDLPSEYSLYTGEDDENDGADKPQSVRQQPTERAYFDDNDFASESEFGFDASPEYKYPDDVFTTATDGDADFDERPADGRDIEIMSAEDKDLAFFENYRYASDSAEDEIIRSVAEALESAETDERERHGFFSRRAERAPRTEFERLAAEGAEPEREPEMPEPDYRERARQYAARCNSLSGRSVLALIITVIIAVATFIFEGGGAIPFGIGRNIAYARGMLLIAQLVVMLLGVDILLRGAKELLTGKISAETLVFASCLASVLTGIYCIRSGGGALPYSALSAMSLTFAMWGERMYTHAMTETLRSAASVREQYSVISEYRPDLERTILKKKMGSRRGFYDNLTDKDACETAYGFAAPILLIFSVVISIYAALAHGKVEYIPTMLAATTAASAAFTATTSFAVPFRLAARRAKARDSAIAGAGGADDIFYTDGCCISDDDIYPPDTLDIRGIRILEQIPPEKAIRYTASLIVASGSCLARKFTEILLKEGLGLLTTQDFAVSEGGVSGVIRGENVLSGNFAFMNLHGVRVPDELKLGNSVYTAVNGRLTAVFPVEYRPSGRIRSAILSVLRRSSRLFLTVRDFNITPMTIEQRFKIPLEDFELLPIRSTYALADEGRGRAVAICGNGGLPELSELISSAHRIKIISLIMTVVSVTSSVAGAFLTALRVWAGGAASAQPGKLLLFMLVPPVISLLLEVVAGLRGGKRI